MIGISAADRRAAGVRARWIILAASCIILMLSTGLRNSFGVFFKSVAVEFGWERATLSRIVSFNMLVFGLSQPLMGRLVDTRGPRAVLMLGAVILGGGLTVTAMSTTLLETYLSYGLIAGVGFGATAITVNTALISRWFDRDRGLALGIAAAGLSAGQIVVIPLATTLLVAVGWRQGFIALGLMTAGLLMPIVFLLVREHPLRETVADAAGQGQALARRETRAGLAMRSLTFWQLTIGFFNCGFAITLISTHFIPFATDFGLSPRTSGRLFSLMGAMSMLGSLATGWVSDRVGRRWPLAGVYFLRAVALLLLAHAQTATDLWVFAVLFGFSWAAPFPLTSAFTGDLWGKTAIATIFGTMFFIHLVGDATGAYIGGLVFDRAGNYGPVFTLAALGALVGGLSVLSIGWGTKPAGPAPVAPR